MYSNIIEILNKKESLAYYILGAFCTDGNIHVDISTGNKRSVLSSKDGDWLNNINNIIGGDGKLRLRKNGVYELWFYGEAVYDWFNEQGCTSNKSLTLKLPNVPKEYLPDFLRGCIDGDGSIVQTKYLKKGKEYKKTTCYLCGSSIDFLKEIEKMLLEKNIHCSFVNKKNSPNDKIKYKHAHYRVFMNDSKARRFLEWVYYPGHAISMPRKNKLVNDILEMYKK